ncbi:MAG: pyridoxal phosphate-dependent aminotransferase family protein, partial [Bacteroidota bacterium]
MTDLFDKLLKNRGPLGMHSKESYGYFMFPKLEGEISNRMVFRGKEKLVWSLNNYLGLANHSEVRATDASAAGVFGFALPMGARMMSGNSDHHEKLEKDLASFEGKDASILLNYGYQG